VQELLVQFPSLKATRSRLSGKQTPTACSIAVIAFNEAKLGRTLTSGRMEDIWNDPFFR
jgi:hypothetical protein